MRELILAIQQKHKGSGIIINFPVKRIVFDYKSLKSDPRIKIKVGKKKRVITLSENDLKFNKFYFVSKDKVS